MPTKPESFYVNTVTCWKVTTVHSLTAVFELVFVGSECRACSRIVSNQKDEGKVQPEIKFEVLSARRHDIRPSQVCTRRTRCLRLFLSAPSVAAAAASVYSQDRAGICPAQEGESISTCPSAPFEV